MRPTTVRFAHTNSAMRRAVALLLHQRQAKLPTMTLVEKSGNVSSVKTSKQLNKARHQLPFLSLSGLQKLSNDQFVHGHLFVFSMQFDTLKKIPIKFVEKEMKCHRIEELISYWSQSGKRQDMN